MTPQPQPKKANDPATLRCDNEPCLFHHLGICRFSCHAWIPGSPQKDHAMIYDADHPNGIPFPDYINAQRAEATTQAREDVLDELARKIQQTYVGKYDNESGDIPEVPVDELADIIQSLRRTGGEPR